MEVFSKGARVAVDQTEKHPARKDQHADEYFYFNLADESHEKLLEKELREARENPLEPLQEVTEVEY
ncbi:hypothetical protein [Brevibacillus massiliensis]|jgi:hypothetical protein|nr:hypothetical protein [Brevibacillus massiliensis]